MGRISTGAPRRSKQGVTLFASAARTATPTPATFTAEAESVEVIVDITAVTATPAVTFHVERQDPASGKWITLLSSAALAVVATTRLRVSPHMAAVANSVANDLAGGTMRVRPVHGDADSATYTVGVNAL